MAENKSVPMNMTANIQTLSLRARLGRATKTYQSPLISFASVFIFFALWEWVGTTCFTWEFIGKDCKLAPLFLSAPSTIWLAAVKVFSTGDIWNHFFVSGQEFFLGFALAILLGIPTGMLLGWYRVVNYIFEPFISAFNATPRVALTPLLIIWLGIGIWSKVALVFLGGIFPIVINTQSGVRSLDEMLVRAARSFGANDRQIFRTIALPGSVPFILSGIRVGLGRALVGIVVGELLGASAGIGFMMSNAAATFQTDKMFVGLFIITGFGVLFSLGLNRLERRVEAWRPPRG
ncbi:MAG: ABC transporter permease [Chloroflexi bacterium]|nr:ABC transporter permease [Chloroflexota bacterium]